MRPQVKGVNSIFFMICIIVFLKNRIGKEEEEHDNVHDVITNPLVGIKNGDVVLK